MSIQKIIPRSPSPSTGGAQSATKIQRYNGPDATDQTAARFDMLPLRSGRHHRWAVNLTPATHWVKAVLHNRRQCDRDWLGIAGEYLAGVSLSCCPTIDFWIVKRPLDVPPGLRTLYTTGAWGTSESYSHHLSRHLLVIWSG